MVKNVFVSGFAYSGSSAIVDAFSDQLASVKVLSKEIDFIRLVFALPLAQTVSTGKPQILGLQKALHTAERKTRLRRLLISRVLILAGFNSDLVRGIKRIKTYRCFFQSKRVFALRKQTLRLFEDLKRVCYPGVDYEVFVQAYVRFLEAWLHIYFTLNTGISLPSIEAEDSNTKPNVLLFNQVWRPEEHWQLLPVLSDSSVWIVVQRSPDDRLAEMLRFLGPDLLHKRAKNGIFRLYSKEEISEQLFSDVGLWFGLQDAIWEQAKSEYSGSSSVLTVAFEELVERPQSTLRNIGQSMGLPIDYVSENERAFIPTESQRNVRLKLDVDQSKLNAFHNAYEAAAELIGTSRGAPSSLRSL